MRNMIRMGPERLLGHPLITSVAWVFFVGLAPSMGLKLDYPLLARVWNCITLTLHSLLKLPMLNTDRRWSVMNRGRFNKF